MRHEDQSSSRKSIFSTSSLSADSNDVDKNNNKSDVLTAQRYRKQDGRCLSSSPSSPSRRQIFLQRLILDGEYYNQESRDDGYDVPTYWNRYQHQHNNKEQLLSSMLFPTTATTCHDDDDDGETITIIRPSSRRHVLYQQNQ